VTTYRCHSLHRFVTGTPLAGTNRRPSGISLIFISSSHFGRLSDRQRVVKDLDNALGSGLRGGREAPAASAGARRTCLHPTIRGAHLCSASVTRVPVSPVLRACETIARRSETVPGRAWQGAGVHEIARVVSLRKRFWGSPQRCQGRPGAVAVGVVIVSQALSSGHRAVGALPVSPGNRPVPILRAFVALRHARPPGTRRPRGDSVRSGRWPPRR